MPEPPGRQTVPDPRVTPTISVPEAGRLVGLMSDDAAYAAARRGEFPMIRVGRRYRVLVGPLLVKLGVPPAGES